MISPNEKLKFKAILGHRYVTKIEEVLNERGVLDTSNKPYSKGMIRQVFNGYSENFEIEAAIIEATKIQKKYIAKVQKQKSTLLNQ